MPASSSLGAAPAAPRVSIVLPTYNERGNIEPLLAELLPLKARFDLEILVVMTTPPMAPPNWCASLPTANPACA